MEPKLSMAENKVNLESERDYGKIYEESAEECIYV